MIHDCLDQAARYEKYFPALRVAFEFLRRRAKPVLAEGRHEIDGERAFALVAKYTTRDPAEGQPEAHRRYLDVQYLITGSETIYWTPLTETASPTTIYDDERDLIFFGRNSRARPVPVLTGDFVVFFPEDAHQPNCHLDGAGLVHKVVVKVRL